MKELMQVPIIQKLELEQIPAQTLSRYWLHIVSDGLANPILVPLIIAKGKTADKILGVTAAVHGNELNGIPVIQRLFKEIDVKQLDGIVIGIPIVNVPSFKRKKRRFNDGTDLNHIMPGKKDGNVSQVYAYRLFDRIIKHFDYLLDLHTASFGRVNSYYIRADMKDPITAKMALLQNAQIIVHNPPSDGTLRGAAEELGIKAITLEVGNPNTFQKGMIRSGLTGLYNVLSYLNFIDEPIEMPQKPSVICKHSYWLYTDRGGVLTVHPSVTDVVKKDNIISTVQNVFGDVISQYPSPEDGIVIGKSVSPVNQTGGRILHLGIIDHNREIVLEQEGIIN